MVAISTCMGFIEVMFMLGVCEYRIQIAIQICKLVKSEIFDIIGNSFFIRLIEKY
jgi:hypothetical protein